MKHSLLSLAAACGGLALLIAGCSMPEREEIVGTWVLTEDMPEFIDVSFMDDYDTVHLVPEPRLVLMSDSTFFVENFPNESFGEWKYRQISSGRGTWTYDGRSALAPPDVALRFSLIEGKPVNRGWHLSVSEKVNDLNFGDLKLFFYVGDPDSAPRVSFRKLVENEAEDS